MNNITNYSLPLAIALLLPHGLHAATTWTGGTSDFATPSNWDNNSPGNAADDGSNNVATINNGDSVNLTSNYSATNQYNLKIGGNSTLNASADFTATGLVIQSTGTVSLTGGNFTLPKTSVNNNGSGAKGTLNINSGGVLNITGGNHIFSERSTVNGIFRVTGSTSTISLNQIGTANGTFDFIFDSAGISTINGDQNFPWFSIAGASLSIDGSAYTGGTQTFDLLSSTDGAGAFTTRGLSVSGFNASEYNTAFEQVTEGGRRIERLVVTAVPEPSSFSLLGLGGLALMMSRRKSS